jgi:hypothetical protein
MQNSDGVAGGGGGVYFSKNMSYGVFYWFIPKNIQ